MNQVSSNIATYEISDADLVHVLHDRACQQFSFFISDEKQNIRIKMERNTFTYLLEKMKKSRRSLKYVEEKERGLR